MVKNVISKKKFSKGVGPSGVVVEMIRAVVDTGATIICDLAIHSRWEGFPTALRQVVTINWSTLGGLYADAIVIIADSMEEYVCRLLTWKEGMERKGWERMQGRPNHDL